MAYVLGVDWKQIQAMLGHTMLSTTMVDIYVDMVDIVHKDAASKLDGWSPADDGEEDPEDGPSGAEGA